MLTNEQKKQIYANYQTMLNELVKALIKGNLKGAEIIKCDILWRLSHLLEITTK